MPVAVRRARDRPVTNTGWLDSRHSLGLGRPGEPVRPGFGLLCVHNEDRLRAGSGYPSHGHAEAEVVTWLLAGSLSYQDCLGNRDVLRPGVAARVSAGSGLRHREANDAWRLMGGPPHEDSVHLLQMWVTPDTAGLPPRYDRIDVSAELAAGQLVALASGRPARGVLGLYQRGAAVHAARPAGGTVLALPSAPWLHVFVARGSVSLAGCGRLGAGDAARITAPAVPPLLTALTAAEVLVWEMHAGTAG